MKKLHIKIILTLLILLYSNIAYAQSNNNKYNINNKSQYIKNEEEAKAAYSLALFYKERAIASKIRNMDAIKDLESAKVILIEVLKFIENEEIYIALTETYEALGDYQSSIQIYDKMIEEDPENTYILTKAAERNIFFFGNFKKAKYYLEKAYEINQSNNDILILLGFLSYNERKFDDAVYYFNRVDTTKSASNNYMQYYNFYYGMSNFYLSRFKNAIKSLSKVNINSLSPLDKQFAIDGIIKSYQAIEDFNNAYSNSDKIDSNSLLTGFLSFLADKDNEEKNKKIIESINPMDSETPKIISIISEAKNDGYSNALNIIEMSLDRSEVDLDIIQTYYKIVNELGDNTNKQNAEMDILYFYGRINNTDAMPNHIKKLIEYDKSSKFNNLYLQVAHDFMRQNNFIDSKKMLEEYLKLDNKKTIKEEELISFVLTAIKIDERDLAIKAIETYEKNKYEYSYLKAYVYFNGNDIDNANKYLEEDLEYLKNSNTNSDNKINIAYTTAIGTYNTNSTIEYANIIYSQDTEKAENINAMAWALASLNIDLDRAIILSEKSIEKEPKSSHYLDTLGFAYYQKGEYELALKELLKALLYAKENNKAEIYLHIADTYYNQNNLSNALTYYRKAISSKVEDFTIDTKERIEERIETIENNLTKK